MKNNKTGKHQPHYYTDILKRWHQGAGPIPSARIIRSVHTSGLVKPGTKDAFALAMTLRPAGATQAQIQTVLGHPHRNKIKQLVEGGAVIVVPVAKGVICKLEIKRKT